MDAEIMARFQQGEIGIPEFINSVHCPVPKMAVLDGIDYEDAVKFAEDLIAQGVRGKQLLAALQKMTATA